MKFRACRAVCLALAAFVLLSSCTRSIGYGVLLWNDSEHVLAEGTVVRVLFRSDISQVYVIELPGSGERAEIPLWKLTEPASRKEAEALQARYSEFAGQYAFCRLDGLPIREEPENLSRQVYRLRRDEIIRPLYSVEGVPPTSGGEPLEGTWFRVMTDNGTQGYCFSHNLELFQMAADGTYETDDESAAVAERDELLEGVLSKRWYPDYYSTMLSQGRLNLEYFNTTYGFDTGYSSGTTTLSLPNVSASYPYSPYIKVENAASAAVSLGNYKEQDAPIEISVRNDNYIVVTHTDSTGHPRSYDLVSFGADFSVQEAIAAEEARRDLLYRAIQSAGPDFTSDAYGSLTFDANNAFHWARFDRLVPSVIPEGAEGEGRVEIKYFVPSSLASSWDGIITFHFDGAESEVNFLYNLGTSSLRLSYVEVTRRLQPQSGRYRSDVSLPANAVVAYFQR